MSENASFEKGDKVAWNYLGSKDIPGEVKEKCEEKTTIKTGGSTVTRNGEPENPAYVLAMDQGSKAGKEVLKKGSELHMREGEDSKQDQEAKASEKEGDRTEPEQLEDKADGQQEEAAAEPTDDAEEPAAAAEEPPAKRKQDSDDKAGSKKLKNTETESVAKHTRSADAK